MKSAKIDVEVLKLNSQPIILNYWLKTQQLGS